MDPLRLPLGRLLFLSDGAARLPNVYAYNMPNVIPITSCYCMAAGVVLWTRDSRVTLTVQLYSLDYKFQIDYSYMYWKQARRVTTLGVYTHAHPQRAHIRGATLQKIPFSAMRP